MKLASSVYTLKQLNKLIPFIHCAIIHIEEVSLYYENIDLDKAISLCKSKNIEVILAVDKMLYPKDIEFISHFMNQYKDDCLFLATDIAIYSIAKKLNCVNKVIFDPQTMITNNLDLKEYASLGFDSVAMSLEIPLNDVLESIDKTNANVFYQIFGHRLMFYSKRKLLSLYEQKANITSSRKNLYLKESTREDFIPIIENNNGIIIYRSYLISLLENIEKLSSLKYGYMESIYIDDNVFIKIVKLFSDVLNNIMSKTEALNKLKEMNLDIQDGFKYQDSIYQKELF